MTHRDKKKKKKKKSVGFLKNYTYKDNGKIQSGK